MITTMDMNHSKPVPETTPKDFFLNIGMVITLYVSVASFLTLIFGIINYAYSDTFTGNNFYSGGIRFAIASLVIIFPLYLVITHIIQKNIRANPTKREIWVYKWLLFLTLFLAGSTVAVDLIVLINYFLGGELTTQFLLKVFSVLALGALVFGNYLFALRVTDVSRLQVIQGRFAKISAFFVLAAIIGGLFIVGSPTAQREQLADNRRIQDLLYIQSSVVSFWQHKEVLPQTLEEVEDPLIGFVTPTDPETKEEYEYYVRGPLTFELCATFAREDTSSSPSYREPLFGVVGNNQNGIWNHGAGRTCFERTIDPELFPKRVQ